MGNVNFCPYIWILSCNPFPLKGQCHEIFCFWFFSWVSFPPAPEYSIKTVTNFFENSQWYSQVKVHHLYQQHRRKILLPVSLVLLIPVANLPPVSMIPVANLPLVTTTPVASCHRYQQHRRQICHRMKRHQWQTMGTISDCWQLKMNLKEKMYLYDNSTTQRCPKEITKTFLIEDFFHFPPVSTTPVVHLELRISPPIFGKIWNSPNGIIRGLGETDPCRKPAVENLVALSL